MKRKALFITFVVLTATLTALTMQAQPRRQAPGKWEGLADTTQMGWNSWNRFQGNISEDIIKGIADAIVETGLRDAGYIYINIDECWHGQRDADGFIQVDKNKFPSGMKALADYVHSKGLKLGIYSDAGSRTCAGFPGSLGHESQDAIQYARWEIDYLKYDWCNANNVNPRGAYALMRDALRAAGRPILFSMCEWGTNQPWEWAANVGHSWRTTGDITNKFAGTPAQRGWGQTVLSIIDQNAPLRKYAGKGHWNDPDMLEVGNGMPENEDRAHFTMWCMMAAPLILGNDLRNMSQATRDILMNRDMIAVNQDTLGVQGLRYTDIDGLQIWFKPLAGGDWAFTILNTTEQDVNFNLNWQDFNLTDDEVSKLSTNFDTTVYRVFNLWTHKQEGKTSKANKVERKLVVKGHDVIAYRLTKDSKNAIK